MANVGTAVVTVTPSMKGFASAINKELSGYRVAPTTSRKIGESLFSGMGKASSAISGAIGGIAATAFSGITSAIGGLVGQMAEASDSADKFASTLSFAGIDTSTIDALTKSTQEYADTTVYDLADIRNVTAQLAANGVNNYAQLAEAAGNLNAVAGGSADTFRSVSMVMSQTAGSGKLMTENWNQLTDAIPGASGALQDAMRDAGAFEGNFREAMENGEISADEFFAAVQKLGMQDVAVQAATSTSTIEGALGNLNAAIVGVGAQAIDAFKPFITGTLAQLADGISQLPALMQRLSPVMQPVAEAFQTAFAGVQPAVQALVDTVGPQLMPMMESLSGVLAGIAPIAAQLVTSVVETATSIGATVMPIVQNIFSLIQENMPAIQAVITTVMTTVQGVVTTALTAIKALWDAVWPVLQPVVTTVFGAISSAVSSAMSLIQSVISTVTAIISGDWDGAWAGIQGVAESAWGFIQNIVSNGTSIVQSVINGALDVIQNLWNSAWDALGNLLDTAWNSFVETVSGGNENVMNLLRDLPSKIIGIFSGAGRWLIDAGRNILNGLLDGLKAAWDGVTSFIGGIGSWIVEHKGPPSYDAKMLVENGRLIMKGLNKGLSEGWDDTERLIGGMSAELDGTRLLGSQPAYAAQYGGGYGRQSVYNTYNVYIDGSLVQSDAQMAEALDGLLAGVRRTMRLGVA